MDISNKPDLETAIDYLSTALGVVVPDEVLADYLAGRAPHMVGYEKIVGEQPHLPAIAKYMLVAKSYLAQPSVSSFYDIFRAGRVIPFVRRLHVAVRALFDAKVVGLDARLKRMARAVDLDDLDAVLFELVVAAAYGAAVGFPQIEFVPERPQATSPDLLVRSPHEDLIVECKRFDRMTDASVTLRNDARDLSHVVLRRLRNNGISAVVELRFLGRPSDTCADEIADAVLRSLREAEKTQIVAGAHVAARTLTIEPLPNLTLYPSPKYLHERYAYRPERWHGIAPGILGKFAGPSFLDEVEWEAAVLWSIEDEDVQWSIKRLGFTRIFEGLEQLEAAGRQTVLHLWAERGAEHGHRQAQLLKLVETLQRRSKHNFSCIIVNETVANVSLGGRFDFREHATPIAGGAASLLGPLVKAVFVSAEDIRGTGEWGVGMSLPPIDEEKG